MSKKVYLVGVDGSEWSDRATERAVNLAADTGAEVHLIHGIDWSAYQPMPISEIATRPADKKEEARQAEEFILKPLLEKYADKGVNIQSEFDWGHPVEIISAAIKDQKANMVFMGRRGRSRIADMLLGSVANRIAHRVGVPIVLVP